MTQYHSTSFGSGAGSAAGNGGSPQEATAEALVRELRQAAECLANAADLIETRRGQPRPAPTHGETPERRPHRQAGERHFRSMSPDDRVTAKQMAAMHAISRKVGLTREHLAALLVELTGKSDMSMLSRAEASEVIETLDARTH